MNHYLKIKIRSPYRIITNRFWKYYFIVRLVYLFFDVFIYGRLTSLADTHNYLTSGINISSNILWDRTELASAIGGFIGKICGGDNVISNFFAMLFSFYIIKWAVEKLELRKKMNQKILFAAISMPQLCIWTSMYSKECFCLFFSAVLGVLFVNFMRGNYKLHFRDLLALYLCFLFKAQFLPFIFQGMAYIFLVNRMGLKNFGKALLGLSILLFDIGLLYVIQPIVDEMSYYVYSLFDDPNANSTRENIFLQSGDFYRHAPWGMFLAFFGPTLSEMMKSPTHFVAGIESVLTILLFGYIMQHQISRMMKGYVNPYLFFVIFLTFTGICFIHYPVGIFNPGAAIRYRTDFIFFFFIIATPLLTDNHARKKENNIHGQLSAQPV